MDLAGDDPAISLFWRSPMITIFRTRDARLEQIKEVESGCWIHVVDPTTDEIEQLAHIGIPQDYITYPLDVDERSRTEREDDGTTMILLRIPYYQGTKVDVPYTTIPLGIILKDSFIVTICRWQNDIMEEFAANRLRSFTTAKRYRFVLRILLATAGRYLSYLRDINRTVETLEDQLTASMKNNELMELLKYSKSLVYFATALKSNELLMERLQRWQIFHTYPEDEDLLEDVIIENQQAIEMTNISSNILSSMMDAFASIISNNLNVVMKFLASITIVLSIPTIVTSFFGMNVNLPFSENPLAYAYVILMFVGISVMVIGIFVRRNWF